MENLENKDTNELLKLILEVVSQNSTELKNISKDIESLETEIKILQDDTRDIRRDLKSSYLNKNSLYKIVPVDPKSL